MYYLHRIRTTEYLLLPSMPLSVCSIYCSNFFFPFILQSIFHFIDEEKKKSFSFLYDILCNNKGNNKEAQHWQPYCNIHHNIRPTNCLTKKKLKEPIHRIISRRRHGKRSKFIINFMINFTPHSALID